MNLEQLLQHREFLTALARGLVIDPMEQEELLWETMGEVAIRPPRHAALRPWLARVMRNRASNRQRARQRRQELERAGAKQDEVESAAELAARFELVQDLARHVQALKPDFRNVVLFRFFEDLPPREIAKRLALPIETVKTRLRRALAMLRARLDQEHGSRDKWLGSLLHLAFPSAKAVGVGITTLGVLLMTLKTKAALVSLAALLLLLTGTLYVTGNQNETVDAPGTAKAVVPFVPEPKKTLMATKGERRQLLATEQAPKLSVPSPEGEHPVAIKGRCLDEQGRPIAGCAIRLEAAHRRALRITLNSGVEQQGWKALKPVRTGSDGRFVLRGALAAWLRCRLTLSATGYALMSKHWSRSEDIEGVVDLGDIEMLTTCRLYGRVLDEKGRPVSGLHLYFRKGRMNRASRISLQPSVPTQAHSRTAPDGSFEITDELTSGSWEFNSSGEEEFVTSTDLLIQAGEKEIYLEVKVRNAEDYETITGKVMNSARIGIGNARVQFPSADPSYVNKAVYSDRDGVFQIRRTRRMLRDRLPLTIRCDGYEVLRPVDDFAWGTRDLRLVLERASKLRIRVKDSLTGKPIESFGYSLDLVATDPGYSGLRNYGYAASLHDFGSHKDGVLLIEGKPKGVYQLHVVPTPPYLRSARIEVKLPRQADLELSLSRPVKQDLQVLTTEGQVLPDCRVELLESMYGVPIDFRTMIGLSGSQSVSANYALSLERGITDEKGLVSLTGPPDRDLSLRIHAPSHMRRIVHGIRLKADGNTLVVRLESGASIRGVLGPPELWKRLEKRSLQAAQESGMAVDYFRPGLMLVTQNREKVLPAGLPDRVFLQKDGSFSISGIPPGSWSLELWWGRYEGWGCRREAHRICEVDNLEEGETRELPLSFPGLVLGDVSGKVVWNGKLVPQAQLFFESLTDRSTLLGSKLVGVPVKKDGSYQALLKPGSYYCRLRFHAVDQVYKKGIPLGRVLQVAPGSKLIRDFDFLTANLVLRLLDADREPVAGRHVYLRPAGASICEVLPATDKQGLCEVIVPCGLMEVLIAPGSLVTKAAEIAFRNEHGANHEEAWSQALLPLDRVRIGPKGQALECKLPKD